MKNPALLVLGLHSGVLEQLPQPLREAGASARLRPESQRRQLANAGGTTVADRSRTHAAIR